MGFYQTDETQNDGSVITYLHDKPLLADSMTIWKKSIDAFAVSTDGGRTYIAGIDSSGNAVLNLLAVKGIVADWIKAGHISDAAGNMSIDMSNGIVNMSLKDGRSLQIWTSGITMYGRNGSVLTSMFVSTTQEGVLTANHILVGERNNEKIRLLINDNGEGCVLANRIHADRIHADHISGGFGENNRIIITDDIDGKGYIECDYMGINDYLTIREIIADTIKTDAIKIGTHQLQFIDAKDASGNNCHVLGYY